MSYRVCMVARGQLPVAVLPFEPDTESLTFLLYRTRFIGPQTVNFLVSVSHLAMEVWDYRYQTFTLVLYPLSHLPTEFYILSVLSLSLVCVQNTFDRFVCLLVLFLVVLCCCIFVIFLFILFWFFFLRRILYGQANFNFNFFIYLRLAWNFPSAGISNVSYHIHFCGAAVEPKASWILGKHPNWASVPPCNSFVPMMSCHANTESSARLFLPGLGASEFNKTSHMETWGTVWKQNPKLLAWLSISVSCAGWLLVILPVTLYSGPLLCFLLVVRPESVGLFCIMDGVSCFFQEASTLGGWFPDSLLPSPLSFRLLFLFPPSFPFLHELGPQACWDSIPVPRCASSSTDVRSESQDKCLKCH